MNQPIAQDKWPWVNQTNVIVEGKSTWPRISIVTPSYNQAQHLEETIRSVLLQDYPNLEYIVMDGGSKDRSVEIIRKYEDQLTYWASERDHGQAHAINKGWAMATGEIVAWLNSDDLYEPGVLRKVAEVFLKNPSLQIIFGDCQVISKNGELIDVVKRPIYYNRETLLLGKSLPQPSVFLSRTLIEQVGGLDVTLHYALDWAYFLKLFWSIPSSSLHYLPCILSRSREYEGTKSRTGLKTKGNERRRVLKTYFAEGWLPTDLYASSWAATYWLQGTDQAIAGQYWPAIESVAKAIYYNPTTIVDKLTKLPWLFHQLQRVKTERNKMLNPNKEPF